MLIKGAPQTLASPLSRSEKDFLASFSNSRDERVLSDQHLNNAQQAVICARNDASKEEAQGELQRRWAFALKVTKATGRVRWWQVVGDVSPKGTYGMSPPGNWPKRPPAWDHPSIWVRNGRPIVAVSQPYPWLLNDEIESLNEFAGEYGFRFKISNYTSWHYPSRCWFIEWYGEDSVDCDLKLL